MLTRKKSVKRTCEIPRLYNFESSEYLQMNVLPTSRDVLQRLLHEDEWRTSKAAATVASEVFNVWIHCNVYCISLNAITQRIEKYVKEFRKIDGCSAAKRGPTFQNRATKFIEDVDQLFDIFCTDAEQRSKLEKLYKLRMNDKDHEFYKDQKGQRVAKCVSVVENMSTSDVIFKKRMRLKNMRDFHQCQPSTSTSVVEYEENWETDSIASAHSQSSASIASAVLRAESQTRPSTQNRSSLREVALVCERYQLSDRAGAAVASATLKAFGIVSDEDVKSVVDRSKLRRERAKYREEICQKEDSLFGLVDGIYVDGRKDATMIMKQCEGKYYRQTCLEEHYVIVGEPGEFYLSHVTPDNGTGQKIAEAIYDAFKDTSLEAKLHIVGSDGTATMTGWKSGCIASLEKMVGRPLQWAICLLHCNELPLRHVFQNLDGTTTGPDSFSGKIGKQLNGSVSSWDVVNFKPVRNVHFPVLPNDVVEDLSSDQYYAYRICSAVTLGSVDRDLELLEVGALCHSRWLTLGCRLLRYYVSEKEPSATLSILASFLIHVYFPSWFEIKYKSKITDGSRNFFNIIQRVCKLPNKKVRQIALEVLKRNAYFSHSENVLLSMLGDDDKDVRRLAVNKILNLRGILCDFSSSSTNSTETLDFQSTDEDEEFAGFPSPQIPTIRKFKVPKVTETVATYYKMIDLDISMHEPPAIRGITNANLEVIRQQKLVLNHPCHNQSVERHVKLVTDASANVCGLERRDGLIRQKIKSRKLMKCFDTKSQFKA